MTLTIDLAPDEEATLRRRAAQTGQATETVVAALLKQALQIGAPPVETETTNTALTNTPLTDAEFEAYWGPYIGVIHGSDEPLSENCGEKFTDYLVEKKRQGHL